MNFLYETELRRETAVKISLAGFNFPVWDNFWLPLFTDLAVNQHSGRWGSKFDTVRPAPKVSLTGSGRPKVSLTGSGRRIFGRDPAGIKYPVPPLPLPESLLPQQLHSLPISFTNYNLLQLPLQLPQQHLPASSFTHLQ